MNYQNFKTAERLTVESGKPFGETFEKIYSLLTQLDKAKEENQSTKEIEKLLEVYGYEPARKKRNLALKNESSTESSLHITNHSPKQKMEGMRSISTSVLKNEFCQKRRKCEGSICQKCYAENQVKRYKRLSQCLEKNTEILTTSVIPYAELPRMTDRFFRFESFGDLSNDIQFINYLNICEKNPQTNFALWTKNFGIVDQVLKYMNKPTNLFLIASSSEINKKEDLINQFPWIDKVFTVYTSKFAEENGIQINCGSRKCIDCRLCYTENSVKEINELVKGSKPRTKKK